MRPLNGTVVTLLVGSLLACQCLGFGTGSHFDLARMVLTEHGFRNTPIKIVQVESWLTDYYSNSLTYGDKHRAVLEKLHFDNLFDDEQIGSYWAVLVRNLRSSTEKAAFNNDPVSMLVILGLGLHAVQDFYSHSNWAELHPPPNGEFRAETFLSSAGQSNSVKGLYTGKWPKDRKEGPGPYAVPENAKTHGGYHDGLNKDSPGRLHWDEAYVFAYAASHELVNAMETWADDVRPGFWRSVRDYAVDINDEEKLNKDVRAARNISMWLEGKGQDGTWKGEGSGSTRFFSKFAPNWVTEDSSDFVKALRDGTIQNELTADLYSRVRAPKTPSTQPFGLERTALLIRVTYISESNERNFLQRKLLSSLSGPDLYSRITVGEQEFWGRTIQKKREVLDPWYEICIVDGTESEVPIVISVWDEDHTNSAEDEHFDLNPATGVFDLSLVFHTADGSLSGHLNGIFDSNDRVFVSEGKKPEKRRAIIRGFVSSRSIR